MSFCIKALLSTWVFTRTKPHLGWEEGSRLEVLKVDGDEEGAEEEDQAEQVHIRFIVDTLMSCAYHGAIVHL